MYKAKQEATYQELLKLNERKGLTLNFRERYSYDVDTSYQYNRLVILKGREIIKEFVLAETPIKEIREYIGGIK